MTTLDPRALEAAARVVAHQNSEILGHDTWGELEDEQRDCLRSEAAEIVTAYLAVTQPTVETAEGLEGLPVGTVVVDKYGDVCEKRSGWWIRYEPGLIDTASMVYALPARVIWRPQP